MAIVPGSYLDRYKLVAQAGEGGQGAVWQAIDERNGNRPVAIKLHQLSEKELGNVGSSVGAPPSTRHGTHLARLRREAEALRQLNHPSVVHCLGMFEDFEHDILGIVLEWIDGQTLAAATKNPQMSQTHRMWLLGHLIRSLAYLHQTGIVHRDLKFGNVLVTQAFWTNPAAPENVKLVDLGVAAAVGNPNPLTMMGMFVGTSAYVAPEIVLRGKNPALSASTASDVFAFGVMGWRLLCGEHPAGLPLKADFTRFVAFYQAALEGLQGWPAAGSVDGPWGEVLRRCLTLDVNERPRSAVDIVDQLEGRAPRVLAPASASSDHEPTTAEDNIPTRFFIPSERPSSVGAPPASTRAPQLFPAVQTPLPGSRPTPAPTSRPTPTPASRPTPPPSSSPTPGPPGASPLTPTAPLTAPHAYERPSSPALPPGMAPLPPAQGPAPVAAYNPSTGPYQPLPQAQTLASAQHRSPRLLIAVCLVALLVIVGGVGALLMLRK